MADAVDAPATLPSWLDRSAFDAPGGRLPTPAPPEPVGRVVRMPSRSTPAPKVDNDITKFAKDHPEQTRLLAKLIPIARSLAVSAGADGIIVADVRKVAVERGLLTGFERDRALSFLAHLGRAAGLVPKRGFYRKSEFNKERSHGNQQQVWVLPELAL